MSKIQIHNLTKEDCKLLDQMWSLDSAEELDRWLSMQSPGVRNRAMTLVELAVIATQEQEEEEMDTTVAKLMLTSIGVKC